MTSVAEKTRAAKTSDESSSL